MPLSNLENFIKYLNTDKHSFYKLIYCAMKGYKYISFDIPKKSGSFRKINAPIKELKCIQNKILSQLNNLYKGNSCSYGFEKNKNNILNAKNHLKRKFILNIDLENMFDQITSERIKGMLIKKPYELDRKVASSISILCTCENKLPQGNPTSPIISNMILKMLDTKLLVFAKKYKLYYTRYADDLTFSSNYDFSNIVFEDYPSSFAFSIELSNILYQANFIVNTKKTRYYSYYKRQEVTGIITNKKLNVEKNKHREIKLLLHLCKKYGVISTAKKYFEIKHKYLQLTEDELIIAKFASILFGKINYLVNVRGNTDNRYIKIRKLYNDLFGSKFDLTKINDFNNYINKFTFVIITDNGNGTGFFLNGIGLITAYHVLFDKNNTIYNDIKIIYQNKTFKVAEDDIKVKNLSLDYLIINFNIIDIFNCEGFDYEIDFNATDIIYSAGFPDYIEGNNITITTAHVLSIKQKSVVGFISTIDNPIFHGMSGGPVLNEELKVIGYNLVGIDQEEFYKGNNPKMDTNQVKSGFRSIKHIIENNPS